VDVEDDEAGRPPAGGGDIGEDAGEGERGRYVALSLDLCSIHNGMMRGSGLYKAQDYMAYASEDVRKGDMAHPFQGPGGEEGQH
jgi:hypothetical protein